jgi:hypothetical protein
MLFSVDSGTVDCAVLSGYRCLSKPGQVSLKATHAVKTATSPPRLRWLLSV